MSVDEVVCAGLDNSDDLIKNNYTSVDPSKTAASQPSDSYDPDSPTMQNGPPTPDSPVLDDEDDEDFPDVMTGSYSEICFDQEDDDDDIPEAKEITDYAEFQGTAQVLTDLVEQINKENDQGGGSGENKDKKSRPNSLVLPGSSFSTAFQTDQQPQAASASTAGIRSPSDIAEAEAFQHVHRAQQTSDSQLTSASGSPTLSSDLALSSLHRRTGSDTSGLSELQGMLTYDGDMVSFVAEDLQEKIKLSSPVSKTGDTPSFPGSRSSTPSLYKQLLQPQVPLVDAGAVADMEAHARRLAISVDTLLENLSGTLQSISSLTIDCVETYENAVCKTCDSVDANIKSMYQLMAKYEELSNSMKPLYKISGEIKEIKRLLDFFESIVEGKT